MINTRSLLASSTAALALFAAPAFAQDFAEDEVIVTATKRATTLQDTPIAVQVTTGDVIEKAQILDLKDLQSVVPTLRIPQFQNANQTNFIIRGFGNGANNPGIEPSVGVFIDGVYRSRAAAQIGDLPVLERVEVISGPQSTLFGKNASVGVISIVTGEPQFETQGYVEAGYGNYNQMLAKGYITGPVSENVAVALSVGYNKRDGYFEDTVRNEDLNNRDRFSIRGDVLWEPTDFSSFRLIFDSQDIDEECCVAVLTDLIDAAPAIGTAQNGSLLFGAQQLLFGLASNDPADPYTYETALNGSPVTDIRDRGVSLNATHEFQNGLELTSITAYRTNDAFTSLDADFSNVDFLERTSVDTQIDTFTQEVRFSKTMFDDRAAFLVGAFYFDEEIDALETLDFGEDARGLFSALVGGGNPAVGEGLFSLIENANGIPQGTFFSTSQGTRNPSAFSNESYSLFGNVDFDVTDRFTLSLGAAYINDHKEFAVADARGDDFSRINLFGAPAANAATLQGLATNFPNVALACGLGALPFTPGNAAAVQGVAACPGLAGAPGAVAFGGLQAQVAAGVNAIDFTDPNQNPFAGAAALQFLPDFFGLPNVVESGKTNDNEITYSIKGAYEVNNDINVYASYSTGFKASSINLSRDSRPNINDFVDASGRPIAIAFSLLPDNYSVRLTSGQLITNQTTDAEIPANATINPLTARNFGTRFASPEETENIEIGIKTRFDNGSFNLTGFRTSVEGFQSNAFIGSGFQLANAGEQVSTGVEWDLRYRPLDALQLTFAGVYIDAEYEDFQGAPNLFNVPTDRSGSKVAGISPWNLTGSATYSHDFSSSLGGFLRADFIYESSTPIVDANADIDTSSSTIDGTPIASATNFANIEREVMTFNFGAGLDFANGLSLQGYLRNAFNDEYLQSSFNTPGLFGLIRGYPSQPRTYGLLLRKEF